MHPNFKTCNVAIYARCAVGTTGATAIEDQVQRCLAFVKEGDGDSSRAVVFTDYGDCGKPDQRPGFASMMAAVDDGRIGVVVSTDHSRISRDVAALAEVCQRLDRAAVSLVTTSAF